MRLSKLHIAGFKSFPDRAELGFDDGVTAIVGPNGCGKSNVVDAITWVLGEQSAKSLRGDRMEDVIFNGSDARKPTATAEVRLKLTDVAQAAAAQATFDAMLEESPAVILTRDVEIGRRLYRSGESEYLIDGEVCRLRDVHDLLMDSGLGVKAYAVIEQGKIGQILASRPAERRTLIEEAAGVTKYKSRRRSAELKLEAAEQNLTRVDDIIFEVEKQRGALKRQAARARRYRRLREELRRWEQVQFSQRHATLSREIAAAESHLADARAREAGAAARLAEVETAAATLRIGLAEAESRATASREEAHAHDLAIGRRQQQIQFDTQQIGDQARQADVAGTEVRELEGRRGPGQDAIASQRAAAVAAREALQGIGLRVTDLQADYARALEAAQVIEREADETRASVMAAATTLQALRQARDHAAAMRDRISADRERFEIEARELTAEAERVRGEQTAAGTALETGRLALVEAREDRSRLETHLQALRASRETLAAARASAERDLAGRGARLRSLEQLEASRATFGDAARFLLGDAGRDLKRHGALADHLQVGRSFERAVDALLGDLLQHVVVETFDDVAAARELLTRKNVGRCGFVVIEGLSGPDAQVNLPADLPAGAHALDSLVTTTGPHALALRALVGRAIIVESADEARVLAQRAGVPVATRSGDVFRSTGRVETGSRQDVRGIFESRGEVLSLRDEIEAMSAEVKAQAQELARLDASLSTTTAELGEAVNAQHRHEKTIVGVEAGVARTTESLSRVSRRLDVVSTERQRAFEEEAAVSRRRDEAAEAMERHDAERQVVEERLRDVLARLQAAREFTEGRLQIVSQARSEQAALTERASALEQEVRRLEEAARELEVRIAGRQGDIQRTETRREELRASIAAHEHALDEGVRALDALKIGMRALDEQVAALRDQTATRDGEIRTSRTAVESVRTEVMQSELARATATSDLTHLAATCVETVGTTIEDVVVEVARMEAAGELQAPARRVAAAATPDDDEDGDDLRADSGQEAVDGQDPAQVSDDGSSDDVVLTPDQVVADLKKKIDRLGPVNMMAIEQFDDLESRHAFLTTQRKDLLEAISQTGEAIRKIDKTTRERFSEAFAIVNTNFEKTFTTLFGGGRAGLMLIDQENDSESGIDIIAQPPGKRLQNVQLLSGGEKALTAMALMFAIFQYRPSPFCLLDEIDAPLDDANIGRFVEMLQSMQTNTQFILITHNRKTMEIADRLYGVTMEEPGVSKLISVQLN